MNKPTYDELVELLNGVVSRMLATFVAADQLGIKIPYEEKGWVYELKETLDKAKGGGEGADI